MNTNKAIITKKYKDFLDLQLKLNLQDEDKYGDISFLVNQFKPLFIEHDVDKFTYKLKTPNMRKDGSVTYSRRRGTEDPFIIRIVIAEDPKAKDPKVKAISTLFHEVTHLILDHPISRTITSKQQEVVADSVAQAMTLALLGKRESDYRYDGKYVETYIQASPFSKESIAKISDQINEAYQTLMKCILG